MSLPLAVCPNFLSPCCLWMSHLTILHPLSFQKYITHLKSFPFPSLPVTCALRVGLPDYLPLRLSVRLLRHITLRSCASRGSPGFQTLSPTSAPWPLLLHYQRRWRARRRRLMYPFPPPFRTRQPSELPECSLIGIECPFKLPSSHQGGGLGERKRRSRREE